MASNIMNTELSSHIRYFKEQQETAESEERALFAENACSMISKVFYNMYNNALVESLAAEPSLSVERKYISTRNKNERKKIESKLKTRIDKHVELLEEIQEVYVASSRILFDLLEQEATVPGFAPSDKPPIDKEYLKLTAQHIDCAINDILGPVQTMLEKNVKRYGKLYSQVKPDFQDRLDIRHLHTTLAEDTVMKNAALSTVSELCDPGATRIYKESLVYRIHSYAEMGFAAKNLGKPLHAPTKATAVKKYVDVKAV